MNNTLPRHKRVLLRLLLPLALFILGCPPPQPPPPEEFFPEVAQATITVLGNVFYLAPESLASFLVQVQDNVNGQPAANARVQVILGAPNSRGQKVFQGTTDENGLLLVSFDAPAQVDNPNQILTIQAETPVGSARFQERVYVDRVFNVLVSTDKPVYQPGQVIHIRALALDALAMQAAQERPLSVTVEDPEGNRLMRAELTTSRWGVAAADFVLDSRAPSGNYIITAEMGPVTSSRSVEVKPYRLPRFKVDFNTDRTFYLPGETAQATVDAQYFFGKPVAGGEVRITGFVTDVEREQIFQLNGQTGEDGLARFDMPVPDYLVGQQERNTASLDLEITVIDPANHAETITESVTVARQRLLVEAIPESGFLRPGLENIVYVQVSYPDGRAAQAELTVAADRDNPQTFLTDAQGLASFRLTPETARDVQLHVRARDLSAGPDEVVETELVLGSLGVANGVLLRPERAEYRVGETMNLDLLVAGPAQTVYLDVVKGKQTFALAALPVENGRAQAAIDLDGSLLGTLDLSAYVITAQGEIVRDRRFVLVNPAPAQVEVQTDRNVYRPGDVAVLDVTVSREGAAMPGVLGVAIVDESVFSVGAQEPGFARTYFLLERELTKPRYEIHGFSPLTAGDPSPYDDKPNGIRTSSDYGPRVIGERAAPEEEARQIALMGFFAEELAAATPAQEPPAVDAHNPVLDAQRAARNRAAMAWGWGGRLALALPLVGAAFYDGSRRRRRMLVLVAVLSLASFLWVSCASPAASPAAQEAAAPAMEMPAAEEAAPAEAMPAAETSATRGGLAAPAEPPRLRQFFPETLLWLPEVETDAQGHARIEAPIADSITTWRVSILASDEAGNLGSAQTSLRVFQDFFVEPDLPRFLTVGDEIHAPISIFNYLDAPQTIRLEAASSDWFAFLGDAQQTLEVGPNEVTVAYLPIRVLRAGHHSLQITATGSAMSDAVLRDVEVVPDGKPQHAVYNGALAGPVLTRLETPPDALSGSGRVVVKLYPGVVSQAIDGLEGLLRQPYGCFEQTSSTTYPNVLVLDYLKASGQINPEVQLRAEEFINLGYQRLLTFETNVPGGFSLFGDPPPWPMLTAYGLMEFTDMSRVSYVDPALIDRIVGFLVSRQRPDGSWPVEGMTIESGWERMESLPAQVSPLATPVPGRRAPGPELPVTAYITWALADAGYAQSEPVQRALGYLTTNMDWPLDPYVQALIANALIAVDPQDFNGRALLDALVASAHWDEDRVYWSSSLPTYMGGVGDAANLETTALVAIALLRAGTHGDAAQGAVNFLISRRDSFGSFNTTQSTVLALKALILAAHASGEGGSADVSVTLNGEWTQTVHMDDANGDVVQQVVFDEAEFGRLEDVVIRMEGERAVQYQIVHEYYRPWDAVAEQAGPDEAVRIDVHYDRTELAVNDVVQATAEVELLAPGVAGTLLVDLGVPPGFSPLTEDLDDLAARGVIQRYELTGRQILLYMTNAPSGQVYRMSYRLRARFPIRAQTPSSQAYDYYTPTRRDTAPPQRIEVHLGAPGH